MALLRETYEGTPLDMTQNLKVTVKDRKTGKVDTIISPKANPWMRGDELNMLNGIKKGVVKSVRNIAVPQCAYSTVIQLRNWLPDAVGGVVWFSMDNPGQSPRVPVFCGITDFPAMYKICGNHRYRDDAALWHYRRANKLAAVRWGTARKVMEKNIRHFEEKGQRELPFVEAQYQSILQSKGEEAARAYLTDYTADFIGATILRWDEMANQYWITYETKSIHTSRTAMLCISHVCTRKWLQIHDCCITESNSSQKSGLYRNLLVLCHHFVHGIRTAPYGQRGI